MSDDKPRVVTIPDLSKPDWPAFWASLTDADCAEALRAAPRVAGEWEALEVGDWCRPRVAGEWEALEVGDWCRFAVEPDGLSHTPEPLAHGFCLCDGRAHAEALGLDPGIYPSLDLARSACDAALRAQGWRVIG